MKKVLLIYTVLIAAIVIWWVITENKWFSKTDKGTKQKALTVSQHSSEFNESIDKVMRTYFQLTESFVKADTSAIDQNAGELKSALENLKMDDLKKDTMIYETAISLWDNSKTEIQGMLTDSGLEEKKQSFNLFSNELLTLLVTVHYDLKKLYWMECSSAFANETPGNWLSESEQSQNPYGQKDCASVKKVINFMPAESTK